jgi:hypothetical protein
LLIRLHYEHFDVILFSGWISFWWQRFFSQQYGFSWFFLRKFNGQDELAFECQPFRDDLYEGLRNRGKFYDINVIGTVLFFFTILFSWIIIKIFFCFSLATTFFSNEVAKDHFQSPNDYLGWNATFLQRFQRIWLVCELFT